MSKISQQYLIATALYGFSIYQLTKPDYWEFSLYFVTGSAFLVMGLLKNGVFPSLKRPLSVVSWVLIILSAFLLLFLLRTDG